MPGINPYRLDLTVIDRKIDRWIDRLFIAKKKHIVDTCFKN